ncbi:MULTISPECIES: hypothetical protein [unclassified Nostoc]|uniref:hypothetical protein n=1 Tax=unclassified Nostoc TaxID=2593658 RepID=UPI002631448A|nr:hypothetical protein [Nostoc sp. S13]
MERDSRPVAWGIGQTGNFFPMPHAPCPIPYAPCPMPHALCPMPKNSIPLWVEFFM